MSDSLMPLNKRREIEDDPTVQEALKERHADDIWLVECPVCGVPSYWNQGSHVNCRLCRKDLGTLTDDAYTLADYWEYEPYPPDRHEVGAALGRIEREMEKLTATMEQGLMALGYNLQAIHKCVKPRRRRK